MQDSIVIKSTDAQSRKKLLDRWSYVIIISNLIHIEVAINNVSSLNTELNSATLYIGIASLLSCVSMNTYLMYNREYAYLPGTIMFSSADVFNGLLGIFPLMFGLAIFASCIFNE